MDVSKNSGFSPQIIHSSILIGFSIIFTIHFGVPLFLETPIWITPLIFHTTHDFYSFSGLKAAYEFILNTMIRYLCEPVVVGLKCLLVEVVQVFCVTCPNRPDLARITLQPSDETSKQTLSTGRRWRLMWKCGQKKGGAALDYVPVLQCWMLICMDSLVFLLEINECSYTPPWKIL